MIFSFAFAPIVMKSVTLTVACVFIFRVASGVMLESAVMPRRKASAVSDALLPCRVVVLCELLVCPEVKWVVLTVAPSVMFNVALPKTLTLSVFVLFMLEFWPEILSVPLLPESRPMFVEFAFSVPPSFISSVPFLVLPIIISD